MSETITEAEREVPVFLEADVLVCGGGPAGTAAALAAARMGAKVALLERYGCLGGLATGGLVIALPRFREQYCQVIGGIGLELRDTLIREGGGAFRARADSSIFDPEALKRLSAKLCVEAGVDVVHHAWIASAVCEDDAVRGVVFESKSGRLAALADVVIDATGDGDVFASAQAEFESSTQQIGLPYRLIRVNTQTWAAFRERDPKAHAEIMKHAREAGGFDGFFNLSPIPMMPGVAWGNNGYREGDGLDIRVLSRIEIQARLGLSKAINVLKAEMPGFENAQIIETASQLGVRRTRRLCGEYVLTNEDVSQRYKSFPDAIGRGNDFRKAGIVYEIPYRSMLPRRVERLLVAGRCISCTHDALEPIREIHVCWVMGQAAGTAAVLALKQSTPLKGLDVAGLQAELRKANVPFGSD